MATKIIKDLFKVRSHIQDLNSLVKEINKGSEEAVNSMKINGYILDTFRDGGLRVRTSKPTDS